VAVCVGRTLPKAGGCERALCRNGTVHWRLLDEGREQVRATDLTRFALSPISKGEEQLQRAGEVTSVLCGCIDPSERSCQRAIYGAATAGATGKRGALRSPRAVLRETPAREAGGCHCGEQGSDRWAMESSDCQRHRSGDARGAASGGRAPLQWGVEGRQSSLLCSA
jgi:hypothetical protein